MGMILSRILRTCDSAKLFLVQTVAHAFQSDLQDLVPRCGRRHSNLPSSGINEVNRNCLLNGVSPEIESQQFYQKERHLLLPTTG
jgi:hypothetical protein